MTHFLIERLGGLAGVGLPGSAIRSQARIAFADLDPGDRDRLLRLFEVDEQAPAPPLREADSFRYRITRDSEEGRETIEVPEGAIPERVALNIKDELI
jgi:hypothetical protein